MAIMDVPSVPVTKQFLDGSEWMLSEPLRYRILDTQHEIVVPAGFVTDYASIPVGLRNLLSPTGRHGRAAIVHDFLYWDQGCTRDEADALFYTGMQESGVDFASRWAIWVGVRAGGWVAWEANARDRRAGLPRIIPDPHWGFGPQETWSTYRPRLFQLGVKAQPPPQSYRATYCAAAQ